MPSGIRATVEFSNPDICPIVRLSQASGAPVDATWTSVSTDEVTPSVTEFTMDAERESEGNVERIFSFGSTGMYRFPHDQDEACPCERLGHFGYPATRYLVKDGRLRIVFHVADYDELRAVVGDLRNRFPDLDIKRFVRSPTGTQPLHGVFVDRSKLTNRQLEVLETAFQMGYFERPRQANATEVAEALDINPSTFSEHLAAAQRKLLGDVLGDPS